MWKILVVSLIAMLPFAMMSVDAYAQDAALVFNALDADGDGNVSQDEASLNEFVSQGFAAADTNGDGSLTRAEFIAAFGAN